MNIRKCFAMICVIVTIMCCVFAVPAHGEGDKKVIYGPHWSVPLSVQMQEDILDAWNQRSETNKMTEFEFSYYGILKMEFC